MTTLIIYKHSTYFAKNITDRAAIIFIFICKLRLKPKKFFTECDIFNYHPTISTNYIIMMENIG